MNGPDPDFIDALFERACWVIDPLPERAPEGAGQYFAVERYWMESARLRGLYARFASLLLKLCCYYDIRLSPALSEEWTDNPAPERIARWFDACAPGGGCRCLHILVGGDALLCLDGGDIYMALYNPGETLLRLMEQLARSEGLFLRRSEAG